MQNARPDGVPPEGPRYPLASVGNALRLLLMFREKERIRLIEASEQLSVAHSTAHRLLAMLAHHGFVRQEEGTRAYVAGPALVEVGLSVVRGMDIRRHARPLLEEMAAASGETAHLAVLEGVSVRYLDCVESSQAVRVASRTGTTLPAHCTSVGKALLAELPVERLGELYGSAAQLTPMTSRSITNWPRLLAELESVRSAGYATNNGESENDVASVAVVVHDRRQRPVAALSLAAPVSRIMPSRWQELADALLKYAASLAEALPD
jgi:DNA-binding IclR family transcriptional regulator